MSRGVAIGSGLLVTLATPATWPLALATFLIRGGIVLLVVPIVVLPTPVGLATAFGPTLTAIALGRPPARGGRRRGRVGGGRPLWLFGGGWLAAALEAEGARIVAFDEDVAAGRRRGAEPAAPARCRVAGRILAARLIAIIPLLVVLAWGSVRLVLGDLRRADQPARRRRRRSPCGSCAGRPRSSPRSSLAWMAGEIVGAIGGATDRPRRRRRRPGPGRGGRVVPATPAVGRSRGSGCRRSSCSLVIAPASLAAGAAWSAAGDGPRRGGRSAAGPRHGRRPGLPVGGRPGARERRLCLASGRLDRRRGAPAGDVRGILGPPTG